MSSEERLRQAAQLNRAGLSYAERLKQRGLDDLAPRPALTRRLVGLLRQGESVLLVGRPGTGRRSLVRLALHELLTAESTAMEHDLVGVILALMDGRPEPPALSEPVPSPSPVLDIVEVPVSSIQIEAIYVGELETKVAALIENARQEKAALFMPDLHLACGAGASVQNPDRTVATLLLPPLRQGELTLVGSTTPQGLHALRFLQPELLAALVPLEVPDTDDAEAERLLVAVGDHLPHGVRLAASAPRDAVRLSRRSHAGQALPGRAFDLVRETAARLRGDGAPAGTVVGGGDLLETYRLRAGLRPELVHAGHRLRRAHVEQHFASRVVAQPEAVAAVARTVVAFKAGLAGADKPIGTFLFAGPTGVGKTHLAQCLAEYLFGSRTRLLRFDMGEYADADAVERFVGGQAHARESGLLAKVRGTPFAVLLLDEIEKAHPRVLGSLLSLLDEGTLTDARGDCVSAQNTVIILTTNVGAEVYRRNPIALNPGTGDGVEASVRRELERAFSPEFLNRMSDVVVFRPLDEASLRLVAARELEAVARLAATGGLQVRIEPTVAAHVAAASAGSAYGAREVQRAVRRLVVDAIAEAAAGGGLRCLHVNVIDGAVIASDTQPSVTLAAPRRAGPPRTSKAAKRGSARATAERLRSLRSQLVREPGREEHVHEAARALVALGQTARDEGRPDLARKFLREALALWMRLLPDGDCPPELALDVASSHLGLRVLARDASEESRHLVSAVRFLGHAPGRSARAQRMWALTREANGAFFDPRSGEPLVWYRLDEQDQVECFDAPGFHPITRDELKPVTPEIVNRIVREPR
jgi:ATP-dependent Clp protease ATP-binding subunit ClpC